MRGELIIIGKSGCRLGSLVSPRVAAELSGAPLSLQANVSHTGMPIIAPYVEAHPALTEGGVRLDPDLHLDALLREPGFLPGVHRARADPSFREVQRSTRPGGKPSTRPTATPSALAP